MKLLVSFRSVHLVGFLSHKHFCAHYSQYVYICAIYVYIYSYSCGIERMDIADSNSITFKSKRFSEWTHTNDSGQGFWTKNQGSWRNEGRIRKRECDSRCKSKVIQRRKQCTCEWNSYEKINISKSNFPILVLLLLLVLVQEKERRSLVCTLYRNIYVYCTKLWSCMCRTKDNEANKATREH